MIEIDNLADLTGEVPEVHQRCLLLAGKCTGEAALGDPEGFITAQVHDDSGQSPFAECRWPMHHGRFKALVLLSPGRNKITLAVEHGDEALAQRTEVVVRYTPLLQTPPLHLAILIAKDSPLLIDCPPTKFGGLSSAHASLDAAIAKFRMTAYMWQALTAEDLRAKGLGRRSFRLEEEWTTDTLSQHALHAPGTMGLAPKIHLVRTPHTVAELRDADLAQQNPHARRKDDLHKIFTAALHAHGAPFTAPARPVVAGLLLDAHYDPAGGTSATNPHATPRSHDPLILAHAALGSHDPRGLSLGIFGSHLTYAWPRFLEEVPACLLDATPPGDTVGDDNGECAAATWRACAVGQGAFLHEVGHAFGAEHTEGIMLRGYSPGWPEVFLSCVRGGGEGGAALRAVGDGERECRWALVDALKFRRQRHFWVPGDEEVSDTPPTVGVDDAEGEREGEGEREAWLAAACEAGIARMVFRSRGQETAEEGASIARPAAEMRFAERELAARFDASRPLGVVVTAMNGRQFRADDVWKLFRNACDMRLRVPGTDIWLRGQAVADVNLDPSARGIWPWAVMLKKRDSRGNLVDATKIDVRVGCGLDGAVVYYGDGTTVPCGPRGPAGEPDPGMGGHQARRIAIPKGVRVAKVAVTRDGGSWGLSGLRMWLSNGQAMGALNCRERDAEVHTLVPPPKRVIIGFYGASGEWGMCRKFGIVTAPEDAALPDSVYDMDELQNFHEDDERRKRIRIDDGADGREEEEEDEESDGGQCALDDECDSYENNAWAYKDSGYDDECDPEAMKMYE